MAWVRRGREEERRRRGGGMVRVFAVSIEDVKERMRRGARVKKATWGDGTGTASDPVKRGRRGLWPQRQWVEQGGGRGEVHDRCCTGVCCQPAVTKWQEGVG